MTRERNLSRALLAALLFVLPAAGFGQELPENVEETAAAGETVADAAVDPAQESDGAAAGENAPRPEPPVEAASNPPGEAASASSPPPSPSSGSDPGSTDPSALIPAPPSGETAAAQQGVGGDGGPRDANESSVDEPRGSSGGLDGHDPSGGLAGHDPSGGLAGRDPWWIATAGLGALAAGAVLLYFRARRRARAAAASRRRLEQRLEEAVDLRMAKAGNDLVRSLLEDARWEVSSRAREAIEELDGHFAALREELEEHARSLDERLLARLATLQEELAQRSASHRETLQHEAQSLSECLTTDLTSRAAGVARAWQEGPVPSPETVAHAVDALPGDERARLVAALQAAGRLGEWIDQLWPAFETAVGCDLDAVAAGLPEPAGEEWRRALEILRRFARRDAAALRRLLPDAVPAVWDDDAWPVEADLAEANGDLPRRLRRYLEPFDHPGRLGEAVLALQYLLEAFPVEQLPSEKRSALRRAVGGALREAGIDDDFHALVEVLARGIGLEYRPVRYYRSRIDSSDLAFVRQQVSPISLTERVGFEATAEPTAVVRLERPFFFHLSSNVYYAGHAYVARG